MRKNSNTISDEQLLRNAANANLQAIKHKTMSGPTLNSMLQGEAGASLNLAATTQLSLQKGTSAQFGQTGAFKPYKATGTTQFSFSTKPSDFCSISGVDSIADLLELDTLSNRRHYD